MNYTIIPKFFLKNKINCNPNNEFLKYSNFCFPKIKVLKSFLKKTYNTLNINEQPYEDKNYL